MTGRIARAELAAAGIEDPLLQAGYAAARRLNAEHGKTYYLATLLLPAARRPYVHALYGFARYADDIVDDLDPGLDAVLRAAEFESWSKQFLVDLEEGNSTDPIRAAVIDTIGRWHIPVSYFADFLHSMRMDLTVTEYSTYADLAGYMWGSAAVIGLQMLPILGYTGDAEQVRGPATDLGLAFQLTNFLRDLAEDLDRGRVYLPQDSLAEHGVDHGQLLRARATGVVDDPIRRLLAAEIERARTLYRSAEPGIALIEPVSRDCLRTAFTLYGEILDEIERADYQVFARRASVPVRRRIQVAGAGLVRARRARRSM